MKKRISILGSTGSIGCQTLDVIDRFPERFEIVGLAAGTNLSRLAEQVNKYCPKIVSIANKEDIKQFREMIPKGIIITAGVEGMTQTAVMEEAELVVTSITGTLGLVPTVEAVKAGKDIALANKETLVAAGQLVTTLVKENKVKLLPVDSEHSAIFQCLNGENINEVNKLILTASGGPFRNKGREDLARVTVDEALKHPNWTMGKKITIDSATMMNKGLEIIEARWLFDIGFDNIEVLVHPQSIIHSMVEFADGSVMAQLGTPDMRLPIQYALSYPNRLESDYPKLDLLSVKNLSFEKPCTDLFPCLELAFIAGRQGGTMPAVMNAANEQAVALFLDGRIKFLDIPEMIEKVMMRHDCINNPGLSEILECDSWAREEVQSLIGV
jgi:1-deoxy-D-xylulose-5-phosphate reductoisomerase